VLDPQGLSKMLQSIGPLRTCYAEGLWVSMKKDVVG
jgi:hypothetical protein